EERDRLPEQPFDRPLAFDDFRALRGRAMLREREVMHGVIADRVSGAAGELQDLCAGQYAMTRPHRRRRSAPPADIMQELRPYRGIERPRDLVQEIERGAAVAIGGG